MNYKPTFTQVLVAVLIIGAFYFMYTANNRYERQMAVAEEREKKFNEKFDGMLEMIREDQRLIASLQEQVNNKQNVIVVRDKETAQTVKEVTAPKETEEVIKDASLILTTNIKLEPSLRISFVPEDVQKFSATKIEHDSLVLDKKDLQDIVVIKDQQLALAQKDLNVCQDTLGTCRKSVEDYKKVAVKSKWRKIGDGALKVGYVAAGILIGRAL
jgi:hypothetical protein